MNCSFKLRAIAVNCTAEEKYPATYALTYEADIVGIGWLERCWKSWDESPLHYSQRTQVLHKDTQKKEKRRRSMQYAWSISLQTYSATDTFAAFEAATASCNNRIFPALKSQVKQLLELRATRKTYSVINASTKVPSQTITWIKGDRKKYTQNSKSTAKL